MENVNSRRTKGVTLKDVAKKAGVSVATASLALNQGVGHERIGEETRNLIMETAEEMHYRPNYMARALKRQKTMQIGLAFPNIEHPFTSQFILGLEEVLRKKKYDLLLLNMTNSSGKDALNAIRKVEVGGIDGLIILSMNLKLDGVLTSDIPVIYVDEKSATYPSVLFDARGASEKLASYFIQKGLKKIAYIGTESSTGTFMEREKGYINEMERAGIEDYEKYMVKVPPTLQGGVDAYHWFMELKEKPEAIITFTDNVAHSMLLHMVGAGVKIPEELQVASIDDVELSRMMVPSLTCAHVPIYEMGLRAGERMLEALSGKNLKQDVIVVPVQIMERQSTSVMYRSSLV